MERLNYTYDFYCRVLITLVFESIIAIYYLQKSEDNISYDVIDKMYNLFNLSKNFALYIVCNIL